MDVFLYRKSPDLQRTIGVLFITLGAIITAINDFTSEIKGYIVLFISNILNATMLHLSGQK